ncbi:TPA: hypothetical protein DF272_01395 [Candidatus Falkowbacteria bacterium]|nr:hypothetical protein [Candidatus Falkowbacteria bacterium]
MALHLFPDPQTEKEFFEMIEGLRVYLAKAQAGLDDASDDMLVKQMEVIDQVDGFRRQFIDDCCRRFGLSVDDAVPNSFNLWYENHQRRMYQAMLNDWLCAGCPYCGSLDELIAAVADTIPCREAETTVTPPQNRFNCALVELGYWEQGELERRVQQEFGFDKLMMLWKKMEQLCQR